MADQAAVGPKWHGIIPGIEHNSAEGDGTQSKRIDMGKWNDAAPTHGEAQSAEGDSRGKRIGSPDRDPDGDYGSGSMDRTEIGCDEGE